MMLARSSCNFVQAYVGVAAPSRPCTCGPSCSSFPPRPRPEQVTARVAIAFPSMRHKRSRDVEPRAHRYGFNPGSALAISTPAARELATRSAVTTTLAAGAAGVVSVALMRYRTGVYDLLAICNGILAGLVAITAGCAAVEPWAALFIGSLGAVAFNFAEEAIQALRVDDPLSASAMHGAVGALGAVLVAFFAKGEFVAQQTGRALSSFASDRTPRGIFYGGDGRLLACQLAGAPLPVRMGAGAVDSAGPPSAASFATPAGVPAASPARTADSLIRPQRLRFHYSSPFVCLTHHLWGHARGSARPRGPVRASCSPPRRQPALAVTRSCAIVQASLRLQLGWAL